MKLKFLLFLTLTASLKTFAQTWVADSVYMGAGYANDVYYSFKNDSVKASSNKNWQLAFEIVPQMQGGSVAIRANNVGDTVTVYSLPFSANAKFNTLAPADTMTKNGPLLNPDSTWHLGAFNTTAGASPFDYGWGTYDMTSHHVFGDSLYLVYVGTTPYKLTIKKYHSHPIDSIYYEFKIAKFDGTGEVTRKLYRKADGFENRVLAYYDIRNNQFLNREPDWNSWDVVFTRYTEWIVAGPPPAPESPYPVTGILSNLGVEVAEVDGVNPDTAKYNSYNNYSDYIETIGSDWKKFNNTTFQYEIDTDRTYFVKTMKTNEYYQLKFTGFSSSTGKIAFAKRKVADVPVNIPTIGDNIIAHALVPNPANSHAEMMIDAREATRGARLLITDMAGRAVQNVSINIEKGLNGFKINTSAFAEGTYTVTVTNGTWKITGKLAVQH